MVKWIKSILFKIKDYDRLSSDFNRLRSHAQKDWIHMHPKSIEGHCSIIDKEQENFYHRKIKRDLFSLMNGNKEKQLKDYINKL